MGNYRYVIIENDEMNTEELKHLVTLTKANFQLVGVANEVETAASLIDGEKPDLVFADVRMQERTFFEVLKMVTYRKFKIIFISNTRKYVLRALRLRAIDYIRKPMIEEEVLTSLTRFERLDTKERPVQTNYKMIRYDLEKLNKFGRIGISTPKGYMMKSIEHLTFIQLVNKHCELCFGETEKYIMTRSLLDIEVMLEPYGFLRIHQSYIINLSWMEFFDSEELIVYLPNGVALPVATRRKAVLLERLKKVI